MPLVKMLDRNVQSIVSAETHKDLRDIAYRKETTLKELIRSILTDYARENRVVTDA